MRALWAATALALALGAASPAARAQARGPEDPARAAIVAVRVTRQAYDPLLPWLKEAEQSVRGNAVVVAGRRLVTTADLVRDATLIEVRKFGRYPDFPAEAVRVDYDLNLALLTVDDPAFWADLAPLPLAERPVLSGRFTINRWRANARFEQGTGEVVDYVVSNSPYGLMEFPVMRATTAMTGLGWSEVLTSQGAVIGLITSHNNQQIQALNSDLLRLLVRAAEQGRPGAFAHRGFAWQRLNQSHLRAFFGLEERDTGVLIRHLFPGGTGSGQLRPWDILHRINGYAIDPEGRIQHPHYGLLLFTMAINESLAPTISAEITRDGRRMHLELERSRFRREDYRIPPPRFDGPADFEVFGGLVLRELTVGYLRAWGDNWRTQAPSRLVIEYALDSLREKGTTPEKVVIISRVLPDPSNLGYEDVTNAVVVAANERPVHALDDFRAAVRHPVGRFHQIDLLPGQARRRMVFQADRLGQINARVRQRYDVPAR